MWGPVGFFGGGIAVGCGATVIGIALAGSIFGLPLVLMGGFFAGKKLKKVMKKKTSSS
jgi:hypothetical protein